MSRPSQVGRCGASSLMGLPVPILREDGVISSMELLEKPSKDFSKSSEQPGSHDLQPLQACGVGRKEPLTWVWHTSH